MASAAEYVLVDGAACSPVRTRGGCASCAEVCPAGAVQMASAAPTVSDRCFGCGRCAAACPVGALAVKGFGEATDSSPRGERVFVECVRVPLGRAIAGAIRVPCLGGLTVPHLLALRLAAGAAAVVLMDRGWCGQCAAGRGDAMPARDSLAKVRDLLAHLGLPSAFVPRLQRSPLNPALRDDSAARSGVSRRGLFRRLGASGAGAPGRTPVAPVSTDAAPVVRAQLRRLALLRRLSDLHGGIPVERLLPSVSVSDACCDTGACAAHCPTGALQRWQGETAQGLSFTARHCLECGRCVRACPDKALRIEAGREGSADTECAVVTSHPLSRCRQCGAEAPGLDADENCPRCHHGVAMLRTLMSAHPLGRASSKPAGQPQERECHEHA